MFQVQSFLAVNTVVNVIEGKSVCLTHSEAEQELGAGSGLLQGPAPMA